MKWLLIYIVALYALWHAIDLEADTVMKNAIAPFGFSVVFINIVVWLSLKANGDFSSSNGSAGGIGTGGSWAGGRD